MPYIRTLDSRNNIVDANGSMPWCGIQGLKEIQQRLNKTEPSECRASSRCGPLAPALASCWWTRASAGLRAN